MKNLFFVLAFMLVGTFAFANNAEVEILKENAAVKLIENSSNCKVTNNQTLVDCLLRITFVYSDGTSETVYVLVKGVSCDEILR